MSAMPETAGEPLSTRPVYTPQQLHAVYERVNLPSRFRYEPGDFSREVVRHQDGHGFLWALQRHTLASVPFENLELHYSAHHQISIHADALYNKIVGQGTGRGGYCLENNWWLGTVLRSVGFDVMTVGARVNSQIHPLGVGNGRACYGGFSHIVNLVTIRGQTYLVDVGFGAGGPTHPLELVPDRVELNVPPSQSVRLRHDAIPENEHRQNKLWILERRDEDRENAQWQPLYCFDDAICFLPQDFEIMNYFSSTHRQSFFTFKIVCSKALLSESGDEIVGEVVMNDNEVHRNVGGKKETLEKLRTEPQRIEALRKYFGIQLGEAAAAGIRGMVSELRTTAPIYPD